MFNAPDTAGGKRAKCPSCGGAIQIPAPAPPAEVFEAEAAGGLPFEDSEFDVEPPSKLPPTDDRKPCPMCGEMIQTGAVKCRFCGEIFDPVLRRQEQKTKGGSDAELTTFDWVLAIICSGIGCIVGIVYIIQGKPKGTKMLLVSICAVVAWNVIGGLLQFMVGVH